MRFLKRIEKENCSESRVGGSGRVVKFGVLVVFLLVRIVRKRLVSTFDLSWGS
jgi:hypothetical protein